MRNPPIVVNTMTGVRYTFRVLRPTWMTIPMPGSTPARWTASLLVADRLIRAMRRPSSGAGRAACAPDGDRAECALIPA